MDRGDRSTERRELCRGEDESGSDLTTPLLSLLTLGVAGVALLGVSDKPDLFNFLEYHYYTNTKKFHYIKHTMQDIYRHTML